MAANKALKEKCRMVTPEFRVSYPHLFKAQSPKPTDKPKYSITMLFPKSSDLTGHYIGGEKVSLKQIINLAKEAEFGPDKKSWPVLESAVIDGDDIKFKDPETGKQKEGYAGHWVIKASTSEENRPSVVGADGLVITNPGELYAGCYARAYVYAYCWFYPDRQKPMKKGVGFILDHVQKIRDGKSFGGKKPVDQVFAPIDAGSMDTGEETEDHDFI